MNFSTKKIILFVSPIALMALIFSVFFYSASSSSTLSDLTTEPLPSHLESIIDNSHPQKNRKTLLETNSIKDPIQPIPEQLELNLQKTALGEKLFNDINLSANSTISCASCHNLSKGGADNTPTSIGIHGQQGIINAPTVYNAGFNFAQTWNGQTQSLNEHILLPLFNPIEMGNTDWLKILEYLNGSTEYQTLFENLYMTLPITKDNMIDAIVEFERSLITPNSRFDRYLKGDSQALNALELEGYQLFKDRGCISCHHGVNMGGNMFQKAGIFIPIFREDENDWNGRFNITGNPSDKGLFKVPTLRNIALTAPYFHDGSAKDLTEAINIMAKHQLGITLAETENNKIKAFLESLTGQYKGLQL